MDMTSAGFIPRWVRICCKACPSDINDEEWSLVVPYLLLQREDAGQREHDLCEVFNDCAIS